VTVERLSNQRWGFSSMCFVCEDANPHGLRLPFFHDTEAGTVFADVDLTETFSGAPSYAHGGILMALMDEAMSWATIAVAGTFAMTASNEHRFLRPVRLGRPYRVEARIEGTDGEAIATVASITSASTGKVAADGRARFVPLDASGTEAAVGQAVIGADAAFIRDQ